ncbi:MAG: N-acetyl-gamma-glutamyl-phosphate reductase [Actinomycetota bacterium]
MAGSTKLRVAVLGASGYTGGELVRLLLAHPDVELAYLGAKESAGRSLGEVHPHLGASPLAGSRLEPLDRAAVVERAGFAFLALPHGASAQVAPPLLDGGLRVVDLAGDFRLPAGAYPEWYGFEHPAPAWLDKAVYGLPELFPREIAAATLVANPGCYPTPVALGLAPLLSAGLIGPGPVLVDGKTGLSGAGKGPTEATSYSATEESVRPYRFPRHQHTPEMERAIEIATGVAARVSFVPHLVPSVRGVLVTCYAPLGSGATSESLTQCLAATYERSPFVRVLPPGGMVDTKRTRGSNILELQAVADPRTGTAVVAGALDNLVKGAAGQAVQNLNLMAGFDETAGLPTTGVYP